MVYPKKIRQGDPVYFCTPSLPLQPHPKDTLSRQDACVAWAEALGLRPVFSANFNRHTEIRSLESRRMRLDDFNAGLSYPFLSIVGGGGGAISLLDGIDYAAARKNRPAIMGMSDQTKIVNAVAARAGLVTYYGPNGGFGHWYCAPHPNRDFLVQKTVEEIRSAVLGPSDKGRANLRPSGGEEDADWKHLDLPVESFGCPKVLEGTAIAGHWNAVAQMMSGTDYFLRPKGPKLIFLEALHDVVLPNLIAFERMRVLGYFDQAAILCGGPFWEKENERVREWLISYCGQHRIPLVYHLRFGHIHPISVIPVGAYARFHLRTCELTWQL